MEASTAPAPVQPEAVEVSYGDALEEQANIDQVESAPRQRPQREEDSAENQIDLLVSRKAAQEWTFGTSGEDGIQRKYIQRELSVIAKVQWFSLVGEILDESLGGDNAMSLNSLLSPPEGARTGNLRPQDFQDADTFVQAIGKLLYHAPDFLEKSICIWLQVPDYEWDLLREIMRASPEIGGLSDEQATQIIETFIDQNFEAIRANFRERYPRLRDRWQARAKEAESRSPRR